jgi:hypothetical protein
MTTATIVTVVNQGTRFYLKGTTWAFALERAQRFASTDEAFAAIQKAWKFNKASVMKRAEDDADGMAFEEWAAEFGYDSDSRKAEETYHACVKQTRDAMRVISRDVLAQARIVLEDY